MLPPTEAALLDWALNLMADVVEHEHSNKMNARNIAMVFAPNMTQVIRKSWFFISPVILHMTQTDCKMTDVALLLFRWPIP